MHAPSSLFLSPHEERARRGGERGGGVASAYERRRASREEDRKEGRRRRPGKENEEEDLPRDEDDNVVESYQENFSLQEAFKAFQSFVPLNKLVSATRPQHVWQWYEIRGEASSLSSSCHDRSFLSSSSTDVFYSPVIFLHGLHGSAAVFFQQIQELAEKGYRVLSVQWPAVSSLASFLSSFDEFVSHVLSSPAVARRRLRGSPIRRDCSDPHDVGADSCLSPSSSSSCASSSSSFTRTAGGGGGNAEGKIGGRGIHLFGSELGGLLALHYAKKRPEVISSLVLCNSYLDTSFLYLDSLSSFRGLISPMYHLLPHAVLKQIIIERYFVTPRRNNGQSFFFTADDAYEDLISRIVGRTRGRAGGGGGRGMQDGSPQRASSWSAETRQGDHEDDDEGLVNPWRPGDSGQEENERNGAWKRKSYYAREREDHSSARDNSSGRRRGGEVSSNRETAASTGGDCGSTDWVAGCSPRGEQRGRRAFLRQEVEDMKIRNSKEFLVAQLDSISSKELASRLALQMSVGPAPTDLPVPRAKILLIQSRDADVPPAVAEHLRSFFPGAKVAELRDGGHFPFLSRAEDVTLHVRVHLRNCGVFPDLHLISPSTSSSSSSYSADSSIANHRSSSSSSLSSSYADHPCVSHSTERNSISFSSSPSPVMYYHPRANTASSSTCARSASTVRASGGPRDLLEAAHLSNSNLHPAHPANPGNHKQTS